MASPSGEDLLRLAQERPEAATARGQAKQVAKSAPSKPKANIFDIVSGDNPPEPSPKPKPKKELNRQKVAQQVADAVLASDRPRYFRDALDKADGALKAGDVAAAERAYGEAERLQNDMRASASGAMRDLGYGTDSVREREALNMGREALDRMASSRGFYRLGDRIAKAKGASEPRAKSGQPLPKIRMASSAVTEAARPVQRNEVSWLKRLTGGSTPTAQAMDAQRDTRARAAVRAQVLARQKDGKRKPSRRRFGPQQTETADEKALREEVEKEIEADKQFARTRRQQRGEATVKGSAWVSERASSVVQNLGAKTGPVGTFASVTRQLNRQARRLALLGILIGVLFIPVGFFTFAGWSVVAIAMVLISAVYFVALNAFKLLANVLVAAINTIFAAIGGFIVRAGEITLGLLGISPAPCTDLPGVTSSFCDGRRIMAHGLIPADELNALNIPLLDPAKLMPTMDTKPLIQVIGESTGLFKVDIGSFFAGLFGKWFDTTLHTGNIYVVMAIFFVPTALLATWIYLKVVRPALIDGGVLHGST